MLSRTELGWNAKYYNFNYDLYAIPDFSAEIPEHMAVVENVFESSKGKKCLFFVIVIDLEARVKQTRIKGGNED